MQLYKLPILEQCEVSFTSMFHKTPKSQIFELIYKNGQWIPTWKVAIKRLKDNKSKNFEEAEFLVKVPEGTIIKRVEKINGKTQTKIFMVTRVGLIQIPYIYSNYCFKLNTGITLEDRC